MAAEILARVQSRDPTEPGLLVMTGHQDGILAYGPATQATGELVLDTLALALQAG